MPGDLGVVALGRMPYGEALTLQRDLAARRIAGDLPRDLLVLVEHPPVITLGRGFQPRHLPAPPEFLAARGVEVHEVERGGDVTFHGPGQLVGYPIFDLKQHRQDLHWFLRQLEEALIRALGNWASRASASRGTPASGRRAARSRASASTSASGSPGTASRST
jgi:lipoyl(octanoyl) transferase